MIGCLTGTIVERHEEFIVIEVGGVGFLVHCSQATILALPSDDAIVRLFTDLLVREDLIQLYGFLSRKERALHQCLISVQGVGAKAALAIVGALGVEPTIQAVTLGDSDSIRTAKGVGPKLAVRIVNELQERISLLVAWSDGEDSPSNLESRKATNDSESADNKKTNLNKAVAAKTEAHSALINLGYQHGEASRAIAEVTRDQPDIETEKLIRESLIRLVPK